MGRQNDRLDLARTYPDHVFLDYMFVDTNDVSDSLRCNSDRLVFDITSHNPEEKRKIK